MDERRWTVLVAIALIALSIGMYAVHYLVFQDAHHIWIYFIGDLAFLPIEVLLVTLVLHRLLELRDRRVKMEKMNMVIGTFSSALGTRLLAHFSDNDPGMKALRKELLISDQWSGEDFARVAGTLSRYSCTIEPGGLDLTGLKSFLVQKEDFMIRLLENPLLLEHEEFPELLRAIFHLTEELENRDDLSTLPSRDIQHLSMDACRAYTCLVAQWLHYMHYLKRNYPYLFSLAVRTNPFDRQASVIIP